MGPPNQQHQPLWQPLLLTWIVSCCGTLAAAEKPNVILCMADDLGWGDTGYNGHPVIQTPHLDAMARSGLQFDRFYAAAPVCSPTRAACLTGRHPFRYGIPFANKGHLKREEIHLGEVLSSLGYVTGHFGKWHLGTLAADFSGKRGRKPRKNHMTPGMAGFDEWFSTEYAVPTWDPYRPFQGKRLRKRDPRSLYWHNGHNIVDGEAKGIVGGDSRIILDKALPFIEKSLKERRPFFAVIWFHAPHGPVRGGPKYLGMYPDESEDRQHYYAVVTELDEQVGRLRRRLRELGAAEKTLLWFCSDNGPEGNPGPQKRSQGSAGPFRGRKRSLYEGGVRVPGILEWPAKIPQHRKTDFPAVTSDYLPTILDVLDYRIPDSQQRPYDGVSLLPLIEGNTAQRSRPIAFQSGHSASLTGQRYKLVHNEIQERLRGDNGSTPVAEWELYDLIGDSQETQDIADKHPKVVERMRAKLREWQVSCEASARGADYAQ